VHPTLFHLGNDKENNTPTMPKYDLSVYPNLLKAAELLDESKYTQEQPLNPSTILQYFKTLHPLNKSIWCFVSSQFINKKFV
jgi:hypothetical protein